MENEFQIDNEETIDYRAILFNLLKYWYLFLIFIGAAMTGAFFYNKFAKPIYQNYTTVMISDDSDSPIRYSSGSIRDGFGLFPAMQNLENEIILLRSHSLISETVKKLNVEVSYFIEKDLFTWKELYLDNPFVVQYNVKKAQPIGLKFNIILLSDSKYEISTEGENIGLYDYSENKLKGSIRKIKYKGEHKFGEIIKIQDIEFALVLKDDYHKKIDKEKQYYFDFSTIEHLTALYQGLAIAPINEDAAIIKIIFSGHNSQKIIAFLNKLTEVYIDRNLNRKNRIATNTIAYINRLMTDVIDSLDNAEGKLQDFRTTKAVMDLSYQSKQIYTELQKLEKQRASLIVQHRYYEYLKNYMIENENNDNYIAPTAMGIEDPILNKLILEFGIILREKQSMQLQSDKNPYVKKLNIQIKNLKTSIIESVYHLIETSNFNIKDVNNKFTEMSKEINKLPETERELFKIERVFKLNDAIYTFLLQKRAEAQIAKASTLPDNEVLDNAIPAHKAVIYPKKNIIFLIAFILSLIFPTSFAVIKYLLRDKINEKKDVENITKIPIIGFIFKNTYNCINVINEHSNSAISEAFRSIRTNLQFYIRDKKQTTLLVTSSVSGEGKTFNAINLASAFALFGKKTIILGFDLRKPKLWKHLNLKMNLGITSYLVDNINVEDITQTIEYKNFTLDVITSGPIPPNPAELIAGDKTIKLLAELKKRYDFIIIDTPPIGVVTDTYLLMKHVDIKVFVVRQDYTPKKVLSHTSNDLVSNKINNTVIVINDIMKQKGSKYGYGYNYGYGYGYYDDNNKKKKRRFSKKNQ